MRRGRGSAGPRRVPGRGANRAWPAAGGSCGRRWHGGSGSGSASPGAARGRARGSRRRHLASSASPRRTGRARRRYGGRQGPKDGGTRNGGGGRVLSTTIHRATAAPLALCSDLSPAPLRHTPHGPEVPFCGTQGHSPVPPSPRSLLRLPNPLPSPLWDASPSPHSSLSPPPP